MTVSAICAFVGLVFFLTSDPCIAGIPPEIQPFIFPSKTKPNEEVKVTCSIQKGDKPLAFQWLKNNENLTPTKNIDIQTLQDMGLSVLKFASITSIDSGNYTCSISNEFGSSHHVASLIVEAPPTWVHEPFDVDVTSGERLNLFCGATGLPKPTVRWFKVYDGKAGETELLSSNGSYTVTSVNDIHSGAYLCEARNGIERPLKKTILVHVRGIGAHAVLTSFFVSGFSHFVFGALS